MFELSTAVQQPTATDFNNGKTFMDYLSVQGVDFAKIVMGGGHMKTYHDVYDNVDEVKGFTGNLIGVFEGDVHERITYYELYNGNLRKMISTGKRPGCQSSDGIKPDDINTPVFMLDESVRIDAADGLANNIFCDNCELSKWIDGTQKCKPTVILPFYVHKWITSTGEKDAGEVALFYLGKAAYSQRRRIEGLGRSKRVGAYSLRIEVMQKQSGQGSDYTTINVSINKAHRLTPLEQEAVYNAIVDLAAEMPTLKHPSELLPPMLQRSIGGE